MMRKFFSIALLSGILAFSAVAQQQEAYFGEKITAEAVLLPAEFLKAMEGKTETEVKVRGTVQEVCQMKGCWMSLDMGEGQPLMVRFKDYGFFVPKDAGGKTAIVEGKAFVDTVSVETLRHYAADAGKSQAEINAIREPEQRISFIADGVIIQE